MMSPCVASSLAPRCRLRSVLYVFRLACVSTYSSCDDGVRRPWQCRRCQARDPVELSLASHIRPLRPRENHQSAALFSAPDTNIPHARTGTQVDRLVLRPQEKNIVHKRRIGATALRWVHDYEAPFQAVSRVGSGWTSEGERCIDVGHVERLRITKTRGSITTKTAYRCIKASQDSRRSIAGQTSQPCRGSSQRVRIRGP